MGKKKNEYKKVLEEHVTQLVDVNTGEVIDETSESKTHRFTREPDYVKLYINDIATLHGLSNNDILYFLLKKMNYDQEVTIVSTHVREISKELGISTNHFYKVLKQYVDKEILIKKDRSIYLFNPYIFGRGSWSDIQKIRLTVDYSKLGRKIRTTLDPNEQFDLKKNTG